MLSQPPSLLSQTVDPADPTEDVCSTCGGDGYLESDAFTARRGHYSVTEACPDCADAIGGGEPDDLVSYTHGADGAYRTAAEHVAAAAHLARRERDTTEQIAAWGSQ